VTKKAPVSVYEALVAVRQADYGTTYQITLNGVPVGVTTTPASSPGAKVSIGTDAIASDLLTALENETLLSTDFVVTQYGSTLHIKRVDEKDFSLSTFDGLADKGLQVVKGGVQLFTDLPRRAPSGFVAQVTGDPESPLDNYWVQYDDAGNPAQDGVWRECPQPGTLVNFDKATMPHRLVRKGALVGPVKHSDINPPVWVTDGENPVATTKNLMWTNQVPSNAAIPANTPHTFTDHNSGVKKTLGAGDLGVSFEAQYRYDGSAVDPTTNFQVVLIRNGTIVASKSYRGGTSSSGVEKLKTTVTLVNGDVMQLQLQYDSGATPTNKASVTTNEWYFNFLGTNIFFHAIYVATGYAKDVQLAPFGSMPGGTEVTVTVDAVPFSYTVTGASQANTAIATAVGALIDAHASYHADVFNERITIYRNDNAALVVTATTSFPNDTVFHNPDLNLTVDELVGYTIKNHLDGSEGTITSNTAKTITCSGGLSGGAEDVFTEGDFCSVYGTGLYFVFEPCPWNERGAGDLTLVPFPSFIDRTITDVFFYQNRVGFTSGENVVFSSSGDVFNLFRYSATQLVADDVIDVRSSHKEVSLFHSAVLWNQGLYLFSDNAQWVVSGEPVLSPMSIRIDLAGQFPTSPAHRPVVAGNRLYATRARGDFTQVHEFSVPDSTTDKVDALDITKEVPKYIKGSPLAMVGDLALGFLALLTDADGQKNLYVYSYQFEGSQRAQLSWSRWEFAAGQIVGLDLLDGKLGLVTVHSDGAFLGTVDLNVTLDNNTTDESAQYIDRQVAQDTTGVTEAYDTLSDTTTWTLPYNVATDGSEGTLVVARRSPAEVLTSTRPATNKIAVTGRGDLTATSVYIGVLSPFRYKMSRIYFRPKDEVPETRGRLKLNYLNIIYRDTTDFQVIVTLQGRSPYTYTFKSPDGLPASGTLHVPVQGQNEQVTIELVNNTPGICVFSSIDWEGYYATRSRRV